MNNENTDNTSNEIPINIEISAGKVEQDKTKVNVNSQASTLNFSDAEPAGSQEQKTSNAPQNAGNDGENNQQASANDIKIEFIKSDKPKSAASNNYPYNNTFREVPENAEDINKMKLEYMDRQAQAQSADDIKLNTELDLQFLKNQVNPNAYNSEQPVSKEDFYRGKRVLIDAGPTYEKIDDVRFIGNHSSGKMGFAIAEEAAARGAEVILVAGPVHLECSKNIYRVNVMSAEEMHKAVTEYLPDAKIIILAAAVADFTPAQKVDGKIKKEATGDRMIIELVKTKDILADAGKAKTKEQKLIGFALEADNLIENAKSKLKNKNCDMIVANKANEKDSGFGGDNNTITLIKKDESIKEFPPMSKRDCAAAILNEIMEL